MIYTESELTELRRLRTRLHHALPHSQQAVAIGREMAKVYGDARIRNNPPNPAIDRAMKRLARKLGIRS